MAQVPDAQMAVLRRWFMADDHVPSQAVAEAFRAILESANGSDGVVNNVPSDRLLGRDTVGTGAVEYISVGPSLTFTGSGVLQRAALTGDITAAANANATALSTTGVSAATYGDATHVGQFTVDAKGRITSASNVSISASGDARTLISEVVTSGSQASVTFSGIAATYRDLEIRVRGRGDTAATTVTVLLQFNSDTGTNYSAQHQRTVSTATDFSQVTGQTSIPLQEIPAASATANHSGGVIVTVLDYRGTTFFKTAIAELGGSVGTGGFTQEAAVHSGQWLSTAAINAIKVFLSADKFADGSVVSLYGLL